MIKTFKLTTIEEAFEVIREYTSTLTINVPKLNLLNRTIKIGDIEIYFYYEFNLFHLQSRDLINAINLMIDPPTTKTPFKFKNSSVVKGEGTTILRLASSLRKLYIERGSLIIQEIAPDKTFSIFNNRPIDEYIYVEGKLVGCRKNSSFYFDDLEALGSLVNGLERTL